MTRAVSTRQRILDWLFRDRKTSRIVVSQFPNAPIWVWLATAVARLTGLADHSADTLLWIGRGALTAWALDEVVRGANPFRRLLGAGVLGWQLLAIGSDLSTR